MALTTGQYLTAVLLAVSPTAFGAALGAAGDNPDWKAELQNQGATPEEMDASLAILTAPEYRGLLSALRTPAAANSASQIRNVVWNNFFWSPPPPHPKGANLVKLINLLSTYDET